jgi:preprotein translocase subunit YajC
MTPMFATMFLMAPPSGGAGGGANSMVSTMLMFAAIFAIMYFMMIRPQQKRQKEQQMLLESVKKGDKVIMTGGIHGTISEVDTETNTVLVQIADNTRVRFEKAAIVTKKD